MRRRLGRLRNVLAVNDYKTPSRILFRKCGGPRVLILGNTQNLMEQIVSEALSLTGSTGQQLELSMTAKIRELFNIFLGIQVLSV